ncbi:MAG: DUF4369 domain-containing protein [Bacteroidales bacterium]|nr:DUF4369 domain-containing protein [Bacteroidales bacterium]MBR4215169.1 DUF4369 domain-containing protein [Bacteroidales bacterium]
MKPQLLLPLIALCAACHNADDSYEIDIHCTDCGGANVSMWQCQGKNLNIAGATVFEHGHAVFKGKVDQPQLMYIFVEDAIDYLPVFVENSDIDIDYVFARPSRSVVTGSVCHKKFSDFLQSYSAYSDKGTGIDKMIENAEENSDTLMLQRLTENIRVLEREKVDFQRQYVVQNINSPVSAYILSTDLMYKLACSELDSVTALFPDEIKGSIYLKQVAEYRAKMPNDTAAQNN